MATRTPNFNLSKPEPTDPFGYNSFLPLFNENMEIIDENMGGGGGGGGNVDDVEVNGVSVLNPVTKIAEITSYEEVTQAEYNALPDDKLSNGIAYFIKDSVNGADGFPPLIYSFEERQVGVWADGKPLYQKSYALPNTVNISSNTNLTTYMADITSTLEKFIFAFGCGTDGKSTSPFYIQFYNSQITAWATPAFDANIITVQYTKTTDTAGSGTWNGQGGIAHHYSTNETVIGTWINGKPLYERIITGNLNGASSGTFYINYADISADIEEVIFYDGNIRYNYNLAGTDLVWFNINTSTADNNFKMTLQNQLMASGSPTNRLAIFLSNQSFAKMDLYRIKVQYTKTTD